MEIFLSLGVGLLSISFGWYQWYLRSKLEKSQTRFKLLEHFLTGDLHRTFQDVDYGKNFLSENFAGSKVERELDHLLLFFSHVHNSWLDGILSQDGYNSFEYFFNRMKENSSVTSYLKFHRNIICETTSTNVSPFKALLDKFRDEIESAEDIDIFTGEKMSA